MVLLNTKTGQLFALYHFFSEYPEYQKKPLDLEELAKINFVELKYADKPQVEPYQQIVEGPITDGVQNWLVTDLDLEYLRFQKLDEVTLWKEQESESPVEFSEHYFDNDSESQFRVLAVVMLGGGSPTGYWTSADNFDVLADADFMKGLYSAMLTKAATVHHMQRQMKNAIEQLKTAAEVYNYKVGS